MNESTRLARLVLRSLLAAGVTDVVLSPGSRSTPLALAFAAAERAGSIRLHVRIDERSASFLALGLAKHSHRPVPVVCTSGTAVANLAPAIVEAAYSGIPLVALTADRPDRLRGVGANQTIDQVGFFGQQVLMSVDVHADNSRGDSQTQAALVGRTLAEAAGADGRGPGPVHINLAFDEPLVPDPDERADDGASDLSIVVDMHEPIREPIEFALADMGIDGVPPRGLVIVGDVPNREVAAQAGELASACRWPIIGEPSGNVLGESTVVAHASLLLSDPQLLRDFKPDVVVTIGRFGISRPTMAIVKSAAHHLAVGVAGKDRPDPLSTAQLTLPGVPRPPTIELTESNERFRWLAAWQSAGARVGGFVDDVLLDRPITGLEVARMAWTYSDSRDVLFVASSRTVRFFEAVCDARPDAPWVMGNRGASGIDGLVSTAWGAALAAQQIDPRTRVIAVMGDLAFLHDHNGLIAPEREVPGPNLMIIVVDNNGGGIFSALEQGAPEYAQDFERVFGTPQDVDILAIARAVGLEATRVTDADGLIEELSLDTHEPRVIVVTTSREDEQREWESLHVPLPGAKPQ